ncbi:MobF family relaxase [uncultured Croceitalea sp.]|uniref:MobF family relaxase n=1 Tax=uncultured Croceitalea sp. TaxID=1798908 RepID=UPI00374FD737
MIRMFQSQTSAQAKNYFKDALSKGDYYIEDQEMGGRFNGNLAKRLGLDGQRVDKKIFNQLCDNINPRTGQSLTPRTVENRRVGYDISFHCPKSVSIVHGLGDDKRILRVFEQSVYKTMQEIEADMQTRVRMGGQYRDRESPELIWAGFTHQTARPVAENTPDAHLHHHAFTFNAVFDEVEGRFKAGQFHNIKRDMPYYQARFQKRLADSLSKLGYGIRKTKDGFELAVVPQAAIDLFSKRTNHIGQVALEKGITNPKELDKLGAKTRNRKSKNLGMLELKTDWRKQINQAGLTTAQEERPSLDKTHTPEKAVNHALEHVFTRKSVRRDRQILAEAYKYGVDNPNITLEAIDKELDGNKTVFQIEANGQTLCTTQLVHEQEKRMIVLAREGIGKVWPLKEDFDGSSYHHLNKEQQKVMTHIMHAQDRLTMVRGAAGTGKTNLFKTLVPEIEKTEKQVFLFAPTAEAARDVLKKEGFADAETVAQLIQNKKLQEQLKNQVILIDEAGMLGTQEMAEILGIANKMNARVILSGDPRQHTAVLRGDAMRLCQEVGQIPIVSMREIYRQKNADYKMAVKEISEGNVTDGFAILDKMQAIKEIDPKRTTEVLVRDYIEDHIHKKSAIVVTPTRQQMAKVNQDIREGLKENKLLGKREKSFTVYQNLYLTNPQKQDIRFYRPGQIIQTHQNLPRIKKGMALTVLSAEDKTVTITDDKGTHHILPLNRAKDYDVYVSKEIKLSKGEEIRIVNKNGFDAQGKRLNNRTGLTVTGFTKEGQIRAVKQSKTNSSEFLLDKNFGNFEYAYAITSYSSQGKTVDHVHISQPSATFPASNQKQFYVSVSRGREGVTIYTDDKQDLLGVIQKGGDRQGATELKTIAFTKSKTLHIEKEQEKVIEYPKTIDIDYEPEP